MPVHRCFLHSMDSEAMDDSHIYYVHIYCCHIQCAILKIQLHMQCAFSKSSMNYFLKNTHDKTIHDKPNRCKKRKNIFWLE